MKRCEIVGHKRGVHAGQNVCLSCKNIHQQQYAHRHAARVKLLTRNYLYKKKYGISLVQYEILLAAQNGVCALCLCPPQETHLAVDHDHRTGAVRGLLCIVCNRYLGKIDKCPDLLGRIAEYLDFKLGAQLCL